jgi:hypothetical protein
MVGLTLEAYRKAMGFFSRIMRKPQAVPEDTIARGNVVPFVTRRTEITVEREWLQMSAPKQPETTKEPIVTTTDADQGD